MSDDFDLLETNSNEKQEQIDVNWGKTIDTMKSKGYPVWTVKEDENLIKSYFLKNGWEIDNPIKNGCGF